MDDICLSEEEFDYDAYDLNDDDEEKLLNDDNSEKNKNNYNNDKDDNDDDDDDDDAEVLDIDLGEDLNLVDPIPETSKKDKDSSKSEETNRNEKQKTRETKDEYSDPKRIRRISPLRSDRHSRRPRHRYTDRKFNSKNGNNNYNNNNNRRNHRNRYDVNALLNFEPPPLYDNEESDRYHSNNIELQPHATIQLQLEPQPKLPSLLDLTPIIPPNYHSLNEPINSSNSFNQQLRSTTSEENLYKRPFQPPTFSLSISPLLPYQPEFNTHALQQQQYDYQQEKQQQYGYQQEKQYDYQQEKQQQYGYQQEKQYGYQQEKQQQYGYLQEKQQQYGCQQEEQQQYDYDQEQQYYYQEQQERQDNHNGRYVKYFDSTKGNRWNNSRLSPSCDMYENVREAPIQIELEEDVEYKRKIEEQKRQRDRIFKLKEERRLKALTQEKQRLQQNNVQKSNHEEFTTKIATKTIQSRPNNIELTKIEKFNVRNDLFGKNAKNIDNSNNINYNVFMSDRVVIKRKETLVKQSNSVVKTKPNIIYNSTQTIETTKKPSLLSSSSSSSLMKNYDNNINIVDTNDNHDNNISLFLNNRKIVAKDQQLSRIPLISISNLSVNTTKSRLLEIAQGIGDIQKIQHVPKERCATILFKDVAAAQLFHKQYQRYMLDLSIIDIRLVPRM